MNADQFLNDIYGNFTMLKILALLGIAFQFFVIGLIVIQFVADIWSRRKGRK